MIVVDAHIHLWENPGAPPMHGERFTYTDALARMDEAGVDIAIDCPPVWDEGSLAYSVPPSPLSDARLGRSARTGRA